jgi:hypothetical protein
VKSALLGSVLRFDPHLELGIELVKAFFHPTSAHNLAVLLTLTERSHWRHS